MVNEMTIAHEDLGRDLRRVILTGRLDFNGVEEIVGQLSTLLATAGSSVLIDLTGATLICSMGIRALILNAKNMQQRGGRLGLLVSDGSMVEATLKSVGIDALMPVFTDNANAEQALQS